MSYRETNHTVIPPSGNTIEDVSAEGAGSPAPVKRRYITKKERKENWRRRLSELHLQELNKKKTV